MACRCKLHGIPCTQQGQPKGLGYPTWVGPCPLQCLSHLQVVCRCGMGLHASRLQRCRLLAGILRLRHMCSNGAIQRLYLHATAHSSVTRLCKGSSEGLLACDTCHSSTCTVRQK